MSDAVTISEFYAAEGLEDWRVLSDGACACFRTRSFAEAVRFVQAIGAIAGVEGHPPDVDLRPHGVTVRLVTLTDAHMGMTTQDIAIARDVSAAARTLGLEAVPSALQSVLVVPGASVIAEVVPFWRALLGYEPRLDSPLEDLVDPHGRGPAFWFEQMEELRPDGGGAVHIAVWLPREEAEARVTAALAAGGRLVRDFAPSWWTLADAAGNEADISTAHGRD